MAVDDFSNQKSKSEKRSVPTYSFALNGVDDKLIGAVIPGQLVSYKFGQIEKIIRSEFVHQYGTKGREYLKIVEKGNVSLGLAISDKTFLQTCLTFNLDRIPSGLWYVSNATFLENKKISF